MVRQSIDDPIQSQSPPPRMMSEGAIAGVAVVSNVFTGPPDPTVWNILKRYEHLLVDPSSTDHTQSESEPEAPIHQFGQTRRAEEEERENDLAALWKEMRTWLDEHKCRTDRAAVATYRSSPDDYSVLHLLCKYTDTPLDVVSSILAAAPYAASFEDVYGYLPVHYACLYVDCLEIVKLLLEAHPRSTIAQDKHGKVVPLHQYFFRGATNRSKQQQTTKPATSQDSTTIRSSKVVTMLCKNGAALMQDTSGMTPFHYACRLGATIDDVRAVFLESPEVIDRKDNAARLPIHLTVWSNSRNAPEVFDYLLQVGGTQQLAAKDAEGKLPLHGLLKGMKKDHKTGVENRKKIIHKYLDSGDAPHAAYFAELRNMPSWLQVEALTNPGRLLQRELNRQISKPIPTMILMLDFWFLILLICSYQLAVRETIDCLYNGIPTTDNYRVWLVFMMLTGIYFFAREVMQIISFSRLKIFWSGWACDGTNFVDCCTVVLVFFWVAFMWTNGVGVDEYKTATEDFSKADRDLYRNGMALTAALFWMNLLLFLRTASVDFAVFVGGVFHVLRGLSTFLLSLVIVLIAFAQVFFNVSQGTDACACKSANPPAGIDISAFEVKCAVINAKIAESGDGTSFCEFDESMLQVYYMLLGQVSPSDFDATIITTWVYCAFMFLAVVLLANILIAIVTESYVIVRDQKSSQVFWSNRFAFLVEVESLERVTKIGLWWTHGDEDDERSDVDDENPPESAKLPSARNAEVVPPQGICPYIGFLLTEKGKAYCYNYIFSDFARKHVLKRQKGDIPLALIYGLLLAITMILWVCLGAVSAGLLWPPQIRTYLLTESVSMPGNTKGSKAFSSGVGHSGRDGNATTYTDGWVDGIQIAKAHEELQLVKTELQELKAGMKEQNEQRRRMEERIQEQLEAIAQLVVSAKSASSEEF